ncbi:MAG: 7TM domain-containing protein [Gemmataceae bacterium]
MSKTSLTVITALALAALSGGLIAGRRSVLGPEVDGVKGDAAWNVAVQIEGTLTSKDPTLTTELPPDFRRQHIMDERFDIAELARTVRTARDGGVRRAVWRRRNAVTPPQRFRIGYSFHCITGMRLPSPGMAARSHALDAPPRRSGRDLWAGPLVESDRDEISTLAIRLTAETDGDVPRVRALFDHVAELPDGDAVGALECLQEEAGSAAGKSRLLVALCRNRKIPARLVSGLLLERDGPADLHTWAEAWVDKHWLPMDAARKLFGASRITSDHLVLAFGDSPVHAVGARFKVHYALTDLHNSLSEEVGPPSTAKKIWRRMSLTNLRPEEQVWVKFLLLLPVGALAVSVFRTAIGITTYGTFGPVLLALVCRDPKDFPWALSVFVAIMLTGWVVRKLLDRYHLLMVPRISALLTVIVILLVAGLMLLGSHAGVAHGYVALLPLIILTHMVERFWTVEAEDGTAGAFKTLLWTVIVAIAVAVLVNFDIPVNVVAHLLKFENVVLPDAMRKTFFRYPEALGLVLAGQLLIGRYTGYRLTELFRFKDLLWEEPHGPAHACPGAGGTGRAGNEPPEHGVHPGPQPPVVLPPGGR